MKVPFVPILSVVSLLPVSGICEGVISVPPGIVAFSVKPSYSPIAAVVSAVATRDVSLASESSTAAVEVASGGAPGSKRPLLWFRNVRLIVEDPSDSMSELGSGVVLAKNDPAAELSDLVDATPVQIVSGSFKIESKETLAQKRALKNDGVESGTVETGLVLAQQMSEESKGRELSGSSEDGLVGNLVLREDKMDSPTKDSNGKDDKGTALKGLVAGGSWELVGKGGFVGDERSRLTSVVSIRQMPSAVSVPSDSGFGFESPRMSVEVRGDVQIGSLY